MIFSHIAAAPSRALKSLLPLLLAPLLLTGCVTGMSERQQAGTGIGALAGAVGGGVIAHQAGFSPIAGAAIGAVAGGVIGHAIATALDEEERRQLAIATQQAAEQRSAGAPRRVSWKRVDSSTKKVTASGWVVPKTAAYQRDGKTCRDLTQVAEKDGQSHSQDIAVCRTTVAQAGGSNWVIPE